jgi:hypothetical protein
MVGNETVDGGHEVLGHRIHERRRSEGHPPVPLEEPHHPARPHQLGLVEVEVHPIDALQLEHDMVVEHVGHTSG